MDSRYKKLAKNSVIMLAGNLSSKLILFLLLPLYTHFLSTEEYGESDMIHVYASIILSLVTCCVADGIFVFPKKEDDNGKKSYYSSGLLFVICSYTVISFLLWLLDYFFPNQRGVVLLDKWWIYLMSFSMYIQIYTQQFALSLDKTGIYSLSGVVLTILMAVLALILLPTYGITGYLLSIILANIGSAFFSFIFSKQYMYLSINKMNKEYLKRLLLYGIPLIPNSVMWWLMNGLNRPLMEIHLGLSAIGIYSVAYKFPSALSMVFQVISNGMSISVVEEFEKPDFNAFYNRILRVLTMSVLLIGVLLCSFSKLIISIFADAEFFPSWQYMPILTLAVIFQCMGSFIGSIFMAEKKSKFFFFSSLWGAIASIAFTMSFIHIWGLMGICIAISGAFLVMFISRVYYAWNRINQFNIKYYFTSFFLYSIVVALVSFDVNMFWIITGSCTYIVISYFLNKDEVAVIISTINSRLKVDRNFKDSIHKA